MLSRDQCIINFNIHFQPWHNTQPIQILTIQLEAPCTHTTIDKLQIRYTLTRHLLKMSCSPNPTTSFTTIPSEEYIDCLSHHQTGKIRENVLLFVAEIQNRNWQLATLHAELCQSVLYHLQGTEL